jgi:hypothetical protein
MKYKTLSLLGLTLTALCSPLSYANSSISQAELKAAQDAWGKALIQISNDYETGGLAKAKTTAKAVLDQAYAYNTTQVLFKPTLASGAQTFRTSYQGALAYFVGDDSNYPGDTGFALKGWTAYDYKNAAVYMNGDMALTIGHVILTDKKGKVTTVDKSWGFKKGADGKLRIVLHHSSLPYQPK